MYRSAACICAGTSGAILGSTPALRSSSAVTLYMPETVGPSQRACMMKRSLANDFNAMLRLPASG